MVLKLLIDTLQYQQCKQLLLCLVVFANQEIKAVNYYVNDTALKGDLYTTTIGNDSNDGLSPNTPLLTLKTAYQKSNPGDTIYVDTGIYTELNAKGTLLFENKKNIHFIIAGINNEVLSKKPFPANEKIAPSVFYVENDKPIEQEVYLQHQREAEKK